VTESDHARGIALCEEIRASMAKLYKGLCQMQELQHQMLATCDRILVKLDRSEQKWRRREALRRRRAARQRRELGSTAASQASSRRMTESSGSASKRPRGQRHATAGPLGAATATSRGASGRPRRR
jgi:hypothetical protein